MIAKLMDFFSDRNRRMALVALGGAAVATWAIIACLRTAADLRAEKKLEEELKSLQPALSGAAAVLSERNELMRIAGEFRGWEDSRLILGDALGQAAQARPNSMTWTRAVLQQKLSEGARREDWAYRPRSRGCRIVIGGSISGTLADPVLRSYVETLSEPRYLGGAFGRLRYPGLERKRAAPGAPAEFSFVIEGHTQERPLDQMLP